MTRSLSAVIDLHSHVLPGVDDGPADLEGSLALARAGDGRLVVTLTPAARRRLPRTRAITLTLRLTAKAPDAAQRVVRRVKLEALLLD